MSHYGRGPLPDLNISVDAEDFIFDHFVDKGEGITRSELLRSAYRTLPGEDQMVEEAVDKIIRELKSLGIVQEKIARSSSMQRTEPVYFLTARGKSIANTLHNPI